MESFGQKRNLKKIKISTAHFVCTKVAVARSPAPYVGRGDDVRRYKAMHSDLGESVKILAPSAYPQTILRITRWDER